ncbi:MAG: SAM-dependent methyltransferase [Streptosporangiaceae bacterium]
MLTSTPEGATAYVAADARDTGRILHEAAATLDLSQPVAVMFLMTLQYIPDSDGPHGIVSELMGATPPGSYLVVSDTARDFDERTETATAELNQRMGPVRQTRRSCEEIAAYFEGLDLAEPGLVLMPEWRARADPAHAIHCYAGVGRKP